MLRVAIMRVIGKMVKSRVQVITTIIKIYMKVSSIKTLNADSECSSSKMGIDILVNTRMDNFMGTGSTFGRMGLIILDILVEGINMVVENGNQEDRIVKYT
jgi:hypothetical protein